MVPSHLQQLSIIVWVKGMVPVADLGGAKLSMRRIWLGPD